MTLPIRIENDDIPFFIAGCAAEAIQWEVEGKGYEQWRAERERGPTRLRRGATRLLYRICNDSLKRSKCTKMGVFSASDVIRKNRLIKVFTIQNCSQSVCLQNVLDKDGDPH